MDYYISKTVNASFETLAERVPELLKEQGFGVLTEIDVKKTLKAKLDVDFKKYLILGACNPQLAHQAFTAEDKIGALLPCNVVIIDQGKGMTEVAIINPLTAMAQVGNDQLHNVATIATEKLKKVLEKL